jgi:isoquinoline 1-oxidoreductase subunit beta
LANPLVRFDIPAKVTGAVQYGIDTALPGMCYGAIKISPVFGGRLVFVSEAPVANKRGIKKIVKLDDAVVVVADCFWRARDAVAALEPAFDSRGNGEVSSQTIRERHLAALKSGEIKRDLVIGTGADGLKSGIALECVYKVPYLAHAAMEPLNVTALYRNEGTLEVWAGSQDGLGSFTCFGSKQGQHVLSVK